MILLFILISLTIIWIYKTAKKATKLNYQGINYGCSLKECFKIN